MNGGDGRFLAPKAPGSPRRSRLKNARSADRWQWVRAPAFAAAFSAGDDQMTLRIKQATEKLAALVKGVNVSLG